MKTALIYHHTDLDGYSSAMQIVLKLKNEGYDIIDNIPVNYPAPDKFPYPKKQYSAIYITDISFSKETYNCLLKLADYAKKVIWIDHHETSVKLLTENDNKKLNELQSKPEFSIILNQKVCGTVLSYLYYRYNGNCAKIAYCIDTIIDDINKGHLYEDLSTSTKLLIPKYIYLTDQWDTFKHSPININTVLAYKYFIESENMDNELNKLIKDEECVFSRLIGKISSLYITKIVIPVGLHIKKYVDMDNKSKLDSAFEGEIEGIKTLCVNANGNSLIFGDKINEYDMVCLFNFDGTKNLWSYSIYSGDNSKINCSEIAQKFGGGGHAQASGFSIPKCIF